MTFYKQLIFGVLLGGVSVCRSSAQSIDILGIESDAAGSGFSKAQLLIILRPIGPQSTLVLIGPNGTERIWGSSDVVESRLVNLAIPLKKSQGRIAFELIEEDKKGGISVLAKATDELPSSKSIWEVMMPIFGVIVGSLMTLLCFRYQIRFQAIRERKALMSQAIAKVLHVCESVHRAGEQEHLAKLEIEVLEMKVIAEMHNFDRHLNVAAEIQKVIRAYRDSGKLADMRRELDRLKKLLR